MVAFDSVAAQDVLTPLRATLEPAAPGIAGSGEFIFRLFREQLL